MMFEDKVVLITGAGKGIGKAAAKQFAASGAAVVVAARNEQEIGATAAEIIADGGRALACTVDISQQASIGELLQVIQREYGQLDVLVNNAAVPGRPGREELTLENMTTEDWDFPFQVNVRGSMLCAQAALPLLRQSADASIINVSSTAGRRGMAGRSHYCTSKSALLGLTKALAMELGPQGIRVNCVVPGMTRTELLDEYFRRTAAEQGISADDIAGAAASDAPLGALASPEQVAATMLFLASPAAAAMTGQALDPNMGSFMP
jgi:3-oxoacyl-[acyl-carrier protein] reductase